MQDMVDTATGAGAFSTLVAAVKAAGMVQTLKSPGPFTVFAPTDTAFAALPMGSIEGLLKDVRRLACVLSFHLVPGKVAAADVMKMAGSGPTEAKTVQGQPVTLKTQGILSKSVHVNDAKVVRADLQATNGIIHVVDRVLMPGN